MTNSLRKLAKDLKAFAKRCKDFKYTEQALFVFLLCGIVGFADVTTAPTDKAIQNQRQEITTSIGDMRQQFKRVKSENDKLMKNYNLELIQLMEQGDHVVKSPWSSWQYGANTILNDWKGSYKGRGDKAEKYPYEGILKRDNDLTVRAVSPESQKYSSVPKSSSIYSASNSGRLGTSYGLASTKSVTEPIVGFEVSAAVRPKQVVKGAINLVPKSASVPTAPATVSFLVKPPVLPNPTVVIPTIPKIGAPGTGNGDAEWITNNGSEASLAQQKMENGTLNVIGNGNSGYTLEAINVDMTGIVGTPTANHGTVPHGIQNFNWPNQTNHSAMKLVGGHKIEINGVNINFTGTGSTVYDKWLFHTDGHNDRGDSTWVLDGNTKVNINGSNLIMYTSQYHGSAPTHGDIGFINNGTITSIGSNNKIWITLNAGSWGGNRVQYFRNNNTINLSGTGDLFSYINGENTGGFNITNAGTLNLNGDSQVGIIVNGGPTNQFTYPSSEILLNNPMNINGNSSVGVAFRTFAGLDGGGASFSNSTSDNRQDTTLSSTTRPSIFKINMTGNNDTGMYFKYGGSDVFKIVDYNLNATGSNNTMVFIDDGNVNLDSSVVTGGSHAITVTGTAGVSTGNIGIYKTANAALDNITTDADINIKDSDSSIAILSKGTGGTITSKGNIAVGGTGGNVVKAAMGIVSSGGDTITSTGTLTVKGTQKSATEGSQGLIAIGGGITQSGTATIEVDGPASVGVYTENGHITISGTGSNVKTTGGAFNIYSNGGSGIVDLSNTTIDTGQSSLAFLASNGGKINFNTATTANIAGGSNVNNRGTAFYYEGTSATALAGGAAYSPINVPSWMSSTFGNIGNLTLNMGQGGGSSRLYLLSGVALNLSNLSTAVSGGGLNITGSYVPAMLYTSELTVDQPVNLDAPTDIYNTMEAANLSIVNNDVITGTQPNQAAMAQANLTTTKSLVTLTNNNTINLSGVGSTGMYSNFGILKNNGTINIGDSLTGMYGEGETEIYNTGTGVINMGNNSTGMFSNGATTTVLVNNGKIATNANDSIAMTYKPNGIAAAGTVKFENQGTIELLGDRNTGMFATGTGSYTANNAGTIKLGDSAVANNPNVGVYTDNSNVLLTNTGDMEIGKKSVGIYGYNSQMNGGTLKVATDGIGLYSQAGNIDLNGGTIILGDNDAVGAYVAGAGQTVTNNGTTLSIGKNSYGIVDAGTGNNVLLNSPVSLDEDSVYVYSNDATGSVINNSTITSINNKNYGIYSAGNVVNNGTIDFNNGAGNIGIYSLYGTTGTTGIARNNGTINVGASIPGQDYSIGMAAGYIGDATHPASSGNIENNGNINVNGSYGIGMYAAHGATATNNNNIFLNADSTIGMYIEDNGVAVNNGVIKTNASGLSNVVGVYLGQGAKLYNNNLIDITATNGNGVYLKGGTIVNYGTINALGGVQVFDYTAQGATPTTKTVAGVTINAPAGATSATISKDGIVQTPVLVTTTQQNYKPISTSSIGMYVNTSGKDYTKPINNVGALTGEVDLLIGAEAAESTNSKYIQINDPNILGPYNKSMLNNPQVSKWNIYSGALNWMATVTLDPTTGAIGNIYMAKIPYTNWAGNQATPVNSTDTYNFLDGLEQRYGVEALSTREKQLFNKLNSIGNNEETLFYQATDEMMGHQYGNVQQRINETGSLLDKEFKYLRNDWRNPSKQNNKIKVFGMRNEYNTDTAGIIDYTSNAYGVAYVHEDETVKLGNSSGWYAGAVNNRFKFKDIGGSRENQTMVKAGIFKTMSPYMDHNGSLRWTIAGDVFLGKNEMKRKFLVVDDIFNAKGDYTSYGAAFKTDLGYDIRMSERTHLRPYGALKMEYGRFNSIKEDSGEIRLEVDGNDYYSIKPEVGVEFKYVQPVAVKSQLSVGLSAAYENELGKVGDVNNKARVRFTDADWFGIRGEKDDRRGNGKFDFNLGVDNTRFGVTVNAGYDTKGSNIRGGIGFRAIY